MKDNKTFWRGLGLAHPYDDDTSVYNKEYGYGNGGELDDSWQAFQSGNGFGRADDIDFDDDLI